MSLLSTLSNALNDVLAEKEVTKAKILYILQTHKTIPEGTDPNEVYAEMIANHIHKYFVLKEES